MAIGQNNAKKKHNDIEIFKTENTIILTEAQLEYIKKEKKILGSGVDGTVYGMDSKTAFKFYHSILDAIEVSKGKGIYDSDGVNIRDIKETLRYACRNNNNPINYIDLDGVMLGREEAILRAIEKQKDVKLTYLPQRIIKKDNNRVIGCEYRRYQTPLSVYAVSYIPFLKKRKEIMYKLFVKFKELVDNNIYPVTLVQKDPLFPFGRHGANVLLSFNLEPIFIDLDGISTIYTESFHQRLYDKAFRDFSILAMEVISGIDYDYDGNQDIDLDIADLVDREIPYDIASDFYNQEGFSTEEQVLRLLK